MSHLPERSEKSCLNCGAAIYGRYCQICGQENTEPKETFWHLLTHFINDITHFDGKFFSTLKYLIFKPGFLSSEYLRGRRASYLHPIRMYVFTSAFFFLIFFSLQKETDVIKITEKQPTAAEVMSNLEKKKAGLKQNLQDSMPDLVKTPILKAIAITDSNIAMLWKDTTAKDRMNNGDDFLAWGDERKYRTVKEYDSIQKTLPSLKKDNFVVRRIRIQKIHLFKKYHEDSKEIMKAIMEKFKHLFPQMLFFSLPLFALILQLLYVRNKNLYYVNHIVFTIHLYCGTFILILIGISFEFLFSTFHVNEQSWVNALFVLTGYIFWYKSLRNFYQQKRAKTVLKYCLVLISSLFIMVLIFITFFIFSAMAI